MNTSFDGKVTLAALGRRVAGQIGESMLNGQRRADAVKRAILTRLNDPQPKTMVDARLREDRGCCRAGAPITEGEISEAAELPQSLRLRRMSVLALSLAQAPTYPH